MTQKTNSTQTKSKSKMKTTPRELTVNNTTVDGKQQYGRHTITQQYRGQEKKYACMQVLKGK